MVQKLSLFFIIQFFCFSSFAQTKPYNPDLSWPPMEWAGFKWEVKNGLYNPGPKIPNMFSSNNVFFDEEGLHLNITQDSGVWYCSEIQTSEIAQYGTYTFEMILNPPLPVDQMDPNITIGTFLYEEKTEKEFDVEFASWGSIDEEQNTECSIHSPYGSTKSHLFGTHPATNRFKSMISWKPDEIVFKAFTAKEDSSDTKWDQTGEWEYSQKTMGEEVFNPDYIPTVKDSMKVHINFFIMNAIPPINGKEAELIIRDFKYEAFD